MNTPAHALLRKLPKTDLLLAHPRIEKLSESFTHREIVAETRVILDQLRARGIRGDLCEEELAVDRVASALEQGLAERRRPYYRHVINATGVVMHTGLGRSPLADVAAKRVAELSIRSQKLELDLETGQRGGRDEGCAALIRELTGCEAATIVNNNAAATLIILAALTREKPVLVSRGELVEIGGSYRVPDIMRESGAILVEVGTTNRTHVRDYANRLNEETGMILKVHTSNYRVQGFTKEVSLEEMVAIARPLGVPVVYDMGSGSLIELAEHGIHDEPSVQAALTAGVDLVCFSGDKLLGGPQAGIIAGSREAVGRCRDHQMFRAMRPSRFIYTALEATLDLYRQGTSRALAEIPTLRNLLADAATIKKRAARLAEQLAPIEHVDSALVPCRSQAGSGALPTRELDSWGVKLTPHQGSIESLASKMRLGDPAIVMRRVDDALTLDARTIHDDEVAMIAQRLRDLQASADQTD